MFAVCACPKCKSPLVVSTPYRVMIWAVSFAASVLLAYVIGLKAYAGIAWIPLFAVALSLIPNYAKFAVPPRLLLRNSEPVRRKVEPWRRTLWMFVSLWIGLTFYLLAYGFGWGWLEFLLGGSQGDIREVTDTLSIPLGWFNSAFVVSRNTSFPAAFGIVFANSFFYAAVLTAVTRLVQTRLRQPITQLGLEDAQTGERDEEDL